MMTNTFRLAVAILILIVTPDAARANTAPVVTEVFAQQRPEYGNKVYVRYKVFDADDDIMSITLYASEDGGVTFPILCQTVTGDVGAAVVPGSAAKVAWWDATRDHPGRVGSQYVIRVQADDRVGTVGWLGVYADANGNSCELLAPGGGGLVTIYVAHKFNPGGSARGSRFRIELDGSAQTFVAFNTSFVAIGQATTDISLAYGVCQSEPVVIGQALCLSYIAAPPCSYVKIRESILVGSVQIVNCQFREFSVVNHDRLVLNPNSGCQCVAGEGLSTWSQIRGLDH